MITTTHCFILVVLTAIVFSGLGVLMMCFCKCAALGDLQSRWAMMMTGMNRIVLVLADAVDRYPDAAGDANIVQVWVMKREADQVLAAVRRDG